MARRDGNSRAGQRNDLERTAEKGELVTAQFASGAEGGPQGQVVALADLKDIQVELDIAQDDFAKLFPEAERYLTVDAYPDRKYDGVIHEISPEANRQKATVQVKVQILNPDEYLRPEMNATVKFLANDNAEEPEFAIFGRFPAYGSYPRPQWKENCVCWRSMAKRCSAMCRSSRNAAMALS